MKNRKKKPIVTCNQLHHVFIDVVYWSVEIRWHLKYYNAYHWVKHLYNSLRRREWQLTLVLLPGKSHGWRSLIVCNPWGREELDATERLHFSLSCIGEGNGNPFQCSCLENPRDGGAWWAAFYGVAQSRTWLKRLSSSSSGGSSSVLLFQYGFPLFFFFLPNCTG